MKIMVMITTTTTTKKKAATAANLLFNIKRIQETTTLFETNKLDVTSLQRRYHERFLELNRDHTKS